MACSFMICACAQTRYRLAAWGAERSLHVLARLCCIMCCMRTLGWAEVVRRKKIL